MSELQQNLVKHSATIHISNSLTLVQRKVSNVLLWNAYSNLLTKDEHIIKISDVATNIGWSQGKAEEKIKEALEALATLSIQLNITNKDNKNKWGISTLLASAEIDNGVCKYGYSPFMKKALYNPNIYARLNLDIQKNFKSKYSLALWEFVVELLCSNKVSVWKTEIKLQDFRTLMDAMEEYYDDFKKLNQKILKPAVEEINKNSDVIIEVDFIRDRRKVSSIILAVKYKKEWQPPLPFLPVPILEENEEEELINRLVNRYTLPTKTAKSLVKEYGVESIIATLAVVDIAKDIKNLKAFTITAIKQNYGEKVPQEQAARTEEIIIPALNEEINPIWQAICLSLKENCEEGTYKSWFAKLSFIEIKGNSLFLAATTRFIGFYISNHLSDKVLYCAQKHIPSLTKISITPQ